jgi:hypothetical protein
MVRPPKRIPGERNPVPDADAPMHVARESRMGGHDYGIARAIIALLDWSSRQNARNRSNDQNLWMALGRVTRRSAPSRG